MMKKTTLEKLKEAGVYDPEVGINEALRMRGWLDLHKEDALHLGMLESYKLYQAEFPDALPV